MCKILCFYLAFFMITLVASFNAKYNIGVQIAVEIELITVAANLQMHQYMLLASSFLPLMLQQLKRNM